MAAWVKSMKMELRAVLCGWLAVALILPALLGTASGHPLTPAEELYHQIEQANCLRTGQPVDDQDQHKIHDHDCCLPNLSASQVLVALTSVPATVTVSARSTALVPAAWATPAHHPHHTQLGIPRGPPSLFI